MVPMPNLTALAFFEKANEDNQHLERLFGCVGFRPCVHFEIAIDNAPFFGPPQQN